MDSAYFKEAVRNGHGITGIIFDLTAPGDMGGVAAVDEVRKLDKDKPVFVASVMQKIRL